MKNMKVSLKLIISFLLVVVLAIIVGSVGMYGMYLINSADDALYNENVVAISSMGSIRETLQHERVMLRNMVLDNGNSAKINESYTTLQELERTMTEEFAVYEATITDTSAEDAYYNAKKLYQSEFATLKDEIYQASFTSFDQAYEKLFDSWVTEITNQMVDAFATSMQNNDGWAKETLNDNTALFGKMVFISAIVLVIAAAIAVALSLYLSSMISKPLIILTSFMNKAGSTGDISMSKADEENISKFGSNRDEIGQCISSTASFMNHITTISNELQTVADGDISIDINLLSDNDTMGVSMKKMVDNLNNMFSEINASTTQVSAGAKQVADGAQALAQGSTEQAAAVQQLSSSIAEIAEKTHANAEMALQAASLANTIKDSAEKGSMQMDQMMDAVKEINQASQSINKVIKVIDDIAFQTNILALNAAVEAARAGQHGKGFAVVAEEVRNLAAKSAEAAKDTGGLIANSMEKAELGARIADETSASLVEIVSGINESNHIVSDIAKASEEQSLGISQINQGIDQVAQVIQQNSATAEESAAASEEMSGQSSMLEQLISQFKLKDGGRSNWELTSASGASQRRIAMPDSSENTYSGDYGKY